MNYKKLRVIRNEVFKKKVPYTRKDIEKELETTCKILNKGEEEVKKLLLSYTHSELRTGKKIKVLKEF